MEYYLDINLSCITIRNYFEGTRAARALPTAPLLFGKVLALDPLLCAFLLTEVLEALRIRVSSASLGFSGEQDYTEPGFSEHAL